MKIITVYQCRGCPYFTDYYCRLGPEERGEFYKVVPQENRDKGIIPDWCPLADEEEKRSEK